MPEGPEVSALAMAVQKSGVDVHAHAYGKHLFASGHDWSFGLCGRVRVVQGPPSSIDGTCSRALARPAWTGGVVGKTVPVESCAEMVLSNGLGIDWMTAERAALASLVQTWASSRRQLGLLITDQSCVAGIGIAWGSEILARAGNLRPELPARAQNLRTLASAMLSIREEVQSAYTAFVTHAPDLREVINDWYENLYTLRTMHVYKKGRPLKVGGRTWWVSA